MLVLVKNNGGKGETQILSSAFRPEEQFEGYTASYWLLFVIQLCCCEYCDVTDEKNHVLH